MDDIKKRIKLLEKEKEVLQELLDLYQRLEKIRGAFPTAEPFPVPYPVYPCPPVYPPYTVTSDGTADVKVRFRQ